MCLSGDAVDKWLSCDDVALDAGEREYPEAAKSDILYKPPSWHKTTVPYIISEGAPLLKPFFTKCMVFTKRSRTSLNISAPLSSLLLQTLNESGGSECD